LATKAAPMLAPAPGLLTTGERLLERGGILIRHHARQDVGVAPGRKRHDDLRGSRRIVDLGHAAGCRGDGENRGQHADENGGLHE